MKGVIKMVVIFFLALPLYAEEYRGEIEVGTRLGPLPYFIEFLVWGNNMFTLDIPFTYRYKLSPNISAGLGTEILLFHSEDREWDETGSSFLGLIFLSGPSLRLKTEDGSSPFIDLRTEFGLSHFNEEFDGDTHSDTFFIFSISPVLGYIFNIKNVDIGIGLSYRFFYMDTPNEAFKKHDVGLMLSFTFLHK